ncbi:Inner membrane protein translocase component YidC, long form [Lunatimonas lonarensis]|uniref:Membrane protein insertase YidC n=1 Tax=Lunatimonas lonarensis TaxID=1232681 RepID=R7ZWC7_9BACT|nr:membrane protein insertase YidC [Lunatimonas lonarensis]EON78304.1 Inner membrane protein translocase component YidC, long form [Lunatimonas lonarensis]
MDKNQATGLLLFAGVLLVYSLFFASVPEPLPQQDTTEQVVQTSPKDESPRAVGGYEIESDSLVEQRLVQQFGVFASAASGEEREVILENEDIAVTLSTKGGEIRNVRLKSFKTWQMDPLYLIEQGYTTFSYQLPGRNGAVDLNDLYFSVESSSPTRVVFAARAGSGTIQRIYTLDGEGFEVHHQIRVENLGNELVSPSVQLAWNAQLKRLEEDLEESRRKTYMNYYTADGSYDYLSTGNSDDEDHVTKPLQWVSFKQRFFTSGVIADVHFSEGLLSQSTDEANENIEKSMAAILALPLEDGSAGLRYYFGPNNYNILRKVAPDFDKNVDMGYFFVSWVNKYIIVNLFQFLERYFNNYGIIIILIVFIIKLFLLPLTYKSYIGMAKMRVIKPEIDELKEKFGDDPAKMQQEQMKLFGQLGVSPISGCLPMLLQMPFLLAMFFFFPNSIELRQESFLWAHDLSTYDTFIKLPFTIPFYGAHVSLFTLLMTVSQIAYTHFNNQLTTAQGPMKNIGYIMPVVFMFVLNSFPAALSFYYFVSNMVTFGQQALIKQFVDDTKIREKVEETKLKNANKKKSKFQLKLEEAMKSAEAKKKKK